MTNEKRLNKLRRRLKELGLDTSESQERRTDADLLREVLRLYEDAMRLDRPPQLPDDTLASLRELAVVAFDELGGLPDPAKRSLRDYDHERFGPYLGVSGEPGAAPAIVEAALHSPKATALGLVDPLEIGVAHDAERLGSIGELPSGPDEYREIRLSTLGRILVSTNVGSRLNLRFYGRVHDIWVNKEPLQRMKKAAIESARKRFEPFLKTPDGQPRPTAVDIRFRGVSLRDQRTVLTAVVAAIQRGEIAVPGCHSLVLAPKVGKGSRGLDQALKAITLASEVGVDGVAIEGEPRAAADEMVSLPGLLQYFNASEVKRLLAAAARAQISVSAKNRVDIESVARHVWTGLEAARRMGLDLGKYSLLPLTLEESAKVIERVQAWFGDWTAAPVFYVDIDVLGVGRVFGRRQMAEATQAWLEMVADLQVPVVLMDTVQKSMGYHLLKQGARDPKGIFRLDELRELDAFARALDVHVLWAGGISVAQAYELGRLGVFGLYVTSAVASLRAVGPEHESDPGLAAERFPTEEGVARVKLAIETGFVESRLTKAGLRPTTPISALAVKFVGGSASRETQVQDELRKLVREGWSELAR